MRRGGIRRSTGIRWHKESSKEVKPLQVRCGRVRKGEIHRTKARDGEEVLTPRLRLPTAGRFGITDGRPGSCRKRGEMAKKAHAADAHGVAAAYEFRREAEMRKARQWWLAEFWPRNAEDFAKVAMTPATQENAWSRQVAS